MKDFVTPTVVLSRCIEIDSCRYNGLKIANNFVKKLTPLVNLIPVCPEVEIRIRDTPRRITYCNQRK